VAGRFDRRHWSRGCPAIGRRREPRYSDRLLGRAIRSDRTRLCRKPCPAGRQHHGRVLSTARTRGKATRNPDAGLSGKVPIGRSLRYALGRSVQRGRGGGEVHAFRAATAVKLEKPPYDFGGAFQTMGQGGTQMVLGLASPFFRERRPEISALAIGHRVPAMFVFRSYVESGGLMSDGVEQLAMYRRIADYVGKILNGTKPADLPVEQPTRFELVINLKTAKAIGIELPTSILLRADEVIE